MIYLDNFRFQTHNRLIASGGMEIASKTIRLNAKLPLICLLSGIN